MAETTHRHRLQGLSPARMEYRHSQGARCDDERRVQPLERNGVDVEDVDGE
jgi:hypothetical protein